MNCTSQRNRRLYVFCFVVTGAHIDLPDSDAQVEVEHLDPIEFRQVLYRQYKEVEDLEKIVTHVNVNQRQQRYISLITSLENDIVDIIDKPRMQLDLDTAITQGQGLVAICTPDSLRLSEYFGKLINLFTSGSRSGVTSLIWPNLSRYAKTPSSNNPTWSSFLHDLACYLWDRLQRIPVVHDLEQVTAFEWAAFNLCQFGYSNCAESLHTLVRFYGEYGKLGKVTNEGELITLGNAILELGPSEYSAFTCPPGASTPDFRMYKKSQRSQTLH